MKIVATAASNRAIVLKANDTLDSRVIAAALRVKGMSSQQATEFTGFLMDALEEMYMGQRIVTVYS